MENRQRLPAAINQVQNQAIQNHTSRPEKLKKMGSGLLGPTHYIVVSGAFYE